MLLPHSEKAAETQHCIRDVTANFVDHEPLNGADFVAVRPTYQRSLDPVACDQAVGFRTEFLSCLHFHGHLHEVSVRRAGALTDCAARSSRRGT